ncbi:glycoside hydrolase [Neoconidiobolus thromboides FSU 785]|nr:glycoside hydrolase [Neoconidiobolus thromboides FSU 785]
MKKILILTFYLTTIFSQSIIRPIKDSAYATSASDKVIVGYYADWKANELIPEKIAFDKLTHINYCFAIIKESTYEPYLESEYLLPRVVKAAHDNNVKVLLSIGGWTGSKVMSVIFNDKDKRKIFIDKIVDYIKKFQLDGIDIDWEFPGRLGMACNIINPQNDYNNFIILLRELRSNLDIIFKDQKKLITLAVRVEPLDGPNGPIKDTTELANLIDFINVMAYDINGPWSSTTGPNAPLRHTTANGFQQSYMSGVTSWLQAKFPKEKLVMGLAFYGRSFKLQDELKLDSKDKNQFYVPFSKTIPQGDQQDAMWSDPCPGAPYTYSGVWQWKNLRSQGLLKDSLTSDTTNGWQRHFDQVTMTPWLYSAQKKLLITYDDPESLKHKVEYTKCQGLKGVMIWALHEDNMEFPYKRGSFGLISGVHRHPSSDSYKSLPLPDKIFSS